MHLIHSYDKYDWDVATPEILEALNDPNRYNYLNMPSIITKQGKPLAVISAGDSDSVWFYESVFYENEVIVVYRNSKHGYYCLDVFDTETGEKVWDIQFMNSDWDDVREMGTHEFIEHAYQWRND